MFAESTTRRGFLGKLGVMLGGLAAVGTFAQSAQAGRSRYRYYGGYGRIRGASRVRYFGGGVPYYGAPYGGGYYPRGFYGGVPYAPVAPYGPPVAPYYPPAPGGVYLRLNGNMPARKAFDALSLLEA